MASYFTTPEGRVLHCIAGPVDAATFLREARWAVETWKFALLEGKTERTARFKAMLCKAHFDRLQQGHGVRATWYNLSADNYTPAQMAALLERYDRSGSGLGNAGRVHLLLTTYPLPRLERLYGVVFEKILNEKLSTLPVAQR